jgi:tetratricopeptide (TPR) repeat protein
MSEQPAHELRAEIVRELNQVSHFGHAPKVRELVAQAGQAVEEERYEDAIEPLLEAKTRAPRSTYVRELLGIAYYRLERWRDAVRELAAYRRLSDRRDRDPEFADAERALGRPEKAIEILEDLRPDELPEDVFVEALVVRAGALSDLGRFDDAVSVLEMGPLRPAEALPHHLRLWYALGDALEGAGQRRDARVWWDAVYADDPEFFDIADRRLGLKRRS